MDIINLIQQYAVIPVALACYLIVEGVKIVWPELDKRWIPLEVVPLGFIGVFWINNWAVTFDTVLGGICSAALSVWAHQTVKQTSTAVKGDG